MYREALRIDRKALGNDHPEIPTKLLNLAVLLRDHGRPDAAEPLAQRSASRFAGRYLGDQHPEIPIAMDTLATLLEDQGSLREAEALFRTRSRARATGYGELNLNTARLQHSVGWVLWKQGSTPRPSRSCASRLSTSRRRTVRPTAAFGLQRRTSRTS